MKTTKKGFTLIELIVVIAIIGVLAAILVPSMLGYVRKSKISSANSTASSIYKAINSAITEIDEAGGDIGGTVPISYSNGSWTDFSPSANNFGSKVENFFKDISKVDGDIKARVEDGSCIAVAVETDATYTGTYPSGVVTSETYTTYKGNADLALEAAISVYNA